MIDKKEKIRALFNATFTGNNAWNDWFFSRVYRDDEAMVLEQDGNVLSSLMVKPYAFLFHGSDVGLAYISGVATARSARQQGFMTQLMAGVLYSVASQGHALAAVIPANPGLRFFYDRFGFADAVYYDLQRYTSVHAFPTSRRFEGCPVDYAGFSELEQSLPCTVLHSAEDFTYVIEDLHLDNGTAAAVRDVETGRFAAMAFAVPRGRENHITALYAMNDDAADNVLALVANDRSMVVHAFPAEADAEGREQLRLRAMLRITDAMAVLSTLAKAHPGTEQVIRIHDSLIPANNGVFILHDGTCTRTDFTMRRLSLDVDIAVLTALLFSSPRIGNVFSLRSVRPVLPLMLD